MDMSFASKNGVMNLRLPRTAMWNIDIDDAFVNVDGIWPASTVPQ